MQIVLCVSSQYYRKREGKELPLPPALCRRSHETKLLKPHRSLTESNADSLQGGCFRSVLY